MATKAKYSKEKTCQYKRVKCNALLYEYIIRHVCRNLYTINTINNSYYFFYKFK